MAVPAPADDTPDALEARVRRFFDDFVVAFASFDGPTVAARYAPPYLAMQADGVAHAFPTTDAIGSYFQHVLDEYRSRGCRRCAWDALQLVPLGRDCALATVSWTLLDADGHRVAGWRESYALRAAGDAFRIFASIDHVKAAQSG